MTDVTMITKASSDMQNRCMRNERIANPLHYDPLHYEWMFADKGHCYEDRLTETSLISNYG